VSDKRSNANRAIGSKEGITILFVSSGVMMILQQGVTGPNLYIRSEVCG
jgi:hypothetical protein